ncbi:hypothetical protein [Methanoregula sp.]|uniref:hypothetical protein n=1 Tax=Methanoregula sp. TaxID=2052170 RepID=UPI0023727748|nr:hypothetical protein [Methanoregula sp.]MDD1687920.1 hypothetical protein [Methanoregula sp.]
MNSSSYGLLTLILITCLVLAAGCAGTQPTSSTAQKIPDATGTTPDGTVSLMLTGVPDVRQAQYFTNV